MVGNDSIDFLTSRDQLNRAGRPDNKPQSKSVLHLSKLEDDYEPPKLLVDNSSIELRHPLLKSQQIV